MFSNNLNTSDVGHPAFGKVINYGGNKIVPTLRPGMNFANEFFILYGGNPQAVEYISLKHSYKSLALSSALTSSLLREDVKSRRRIMGNFVYEKFDTNDAMAKGCDLILVTNEFCIRETGRCEVVGYELELDCSSGGSGDPGSSPGPGPGSDGGDGSGGSSGNSPMNVEDNNTLSYVMDTPPDCSSWSYSYNSIDTRAAGIDNMSFKWVQVNPFGRSTFRSVLFSGTIYFTVPDSFNGRTITSGMSSMLTAQAVLNAQIAFQRQYAYTMHSMSNYQIKQAMLDLIDIEMLNLSGGSVLTSQPSGPAPHVNNFSTNWFTIGDCG
ncbi:hypothetical protein [Neolewinella sp.]|uniref:hypothetical protein n=1 Tax=Neolewinella sp. TaxID=2993543 RepID=UPI003B51F67B